MSPLYVRQVKNANIGVRFSLGFVVVCLVNTACHRGDPLSVEILRHAQERWHYHANTTYQLTIQISGDRIEEGTFVSHVENSQIQTLTRNGTLVKNPDVFYSVPGLFTFLQDELELAKNPQRYFGGEAGAQVHQRVRFDNERGYPLSYFRAVFGTEHTIKVDVTEMRDTITLHQN